MTIVRFIGDIHGKIEKYAGIAVDAPDGKSVQIGDFGHGFFHECERDDVADFFARNEGARFIRGNHDSPDESKASIGWIQDGTVEDNVMYIGGAWSIDWQRRVPGRSWWPDEELSHQELEELIEKYEKVKPEIMITHDFPTSAAYEMFLKETNGKQFLTRTGEALDAMFKIHTPKLWLAGHWHIDKTMEMCGTKFICLGELSYLDLNTETGEIV